MNSCPIDGVPPEILSRTFVALNEASIYALSVKDESYGHIDYPVLLSSVCSRWRRIALSTPYLWSYIDFATAGNALKNLEHVKRHLHRAQHASLRMRIGTYNNGCVEEGVEENVKSLLRSSASRLVSLAVSYYHIGFAQQVISTLFTGDVTPPLTKLALFANSGEKRILAEPSILPQEHLGLLYESLQSLYLNSVSPDWNNLPCRNLVELQLVELPMNGTPSARQLADLLRANPGLCSIKFRRFNVTLSSPTSSVLQPIQLPNLEKLYLNIEISFVDWLLNLLVPGSHDLEMGIGSWSMPAQLDPTNTLATFSKRARITSLYSFGDLISLSRLYDHLPYLRILRLSSPMLESTFAGLRDTAHPWPQLDTLEIIAFPPGSTRLVWLENVYKLQSLRWIRHRDVQYYHPNGDEYNPKEISELFTERCGNDRIEVVHSPELGFIMTRSSPFN